MSELVVEYKTSVRWKDDPKLYNKLKSREYYKRNHKEILKKMSEYYKEHKEQHRKAGMKYYIKNADKVRKRRNKRTHNLRDQIIKELGDKCVNCGYSDVRALQIDHVDGGGNKDRKGKCLVTYYNMVLEKIKKGSKEYQVLCANCNWIKVHENNESVGRKIKYKNGKVLVEV